VDSDTQLAPDVIGIREAVFSWTNEKDGSLTPSRQPFNLHIDNELIFKPGCINLIIGPTGSGKTSLLMALLGMFIYYLHMDLSVPRVFPQAKCIMYRQAQGLASIFLATKELHMPHRSHGFRMKR
jgi:ABC-type nitrate/sulfonate/bicarbonate transport system ATPase subunit